MLVIKSLKNHMLLERHNIIAMQEDQGVTLMHTLIK